MASFTYPCAGSADISIDTISFLQVMPDPRRRRGVRIPSWHLLLLTELGILSACPGLIQSLSTGRWQGLSACVEVCCMAASLCPIPPFQLKPASI